MKHLTLKVRTNLKAGGPNNSTCRNPATGAEVRRRSTKSAPSQGCCDGAGGYYTECVEGFCSVAGNC